MRGLNKKEQKKIEEAVEKAQLNTEGEIIPVILSSSNMYAGAHFRLSLLLCGLTPLIAYALPFIERQTIWILCLGMPAAIIGYLLAYIPPVKRFFSSATEFREAVHQKACEIFFQKRLHSSPPRATIMLLISRLERRIEILADIGINEKVGPHKWDELASLFIQQQRESTEKKHFKWDNKLVLKGFLEIIEECGKLLDQHFPKNQTSLNSAEFGPAKPQAESEQGTGNSPESQNTQPSD